MLDWKTGFFCFVFCFGGRGGARCTIPKTINIHIWCYFINKRKVTYQYITVYTEGYFPIMDRALSLLSGTLCVMNFRLELRLHTHTQISSTTKWFQNLKMYTAQLYHTNKHTHTYTPAEPVKDKPSNEMQQKITPLLFREVGEGVPTGTRLN